jgi:hypothetical protein
MKTRHPSAPSSRRALLILLLLPALLPCCETSSDTPASCPPPASGTIRGTVNVPGDSVRWTVVAEGIFADHDRRGSFRARCDEQGGYVFDVPAGRYLVRTDFGSHYYYKANGPVRLSDDADTLTVQGGEILNPINLIFGAGRFDLTLPAGLDGTMVNVSLRDTAVDPRSRAEYASVSVRAQDGHCRGSFGSVPPGAYFIRANLSFGGLQQPFWMPFTRDPQAADTFVVRPGETTTSRAALTSPAARIRGQIQGSWQRLGIGVPQVSLYNADSLKVASDATDVFGVFQFDLYLIERVRIRVGIGDASFWIGGTSFREATEFVVTPGEEVEVTGRMESAMLLTFVADPGIEGSSYAVVRVFDATGHVEVVCHPRIQPADLLAIPGLLGGTYRLRIEPSNQTDTEWLPQWYDRAPTLEAATPIVVPAGGEIVPVTVRLLTGGKIEGRVFDHQGNPDAFFGLILTPAARDTCLRRDYIGDPDGQFRFIGLSDGDYKVGVTHRFLFEDGPCSGSPSDSLIWYPGTASWDSAAAISIRGAQVVSDLEFNLPARPPVAASSTAPK